MTSSDSSDRNHARPFATPHRTPEPRSPSPLLLAESHRSFEEMAAPKKWRIGFTGTRVGASAYQRSEVARILRHYHPMQFHHGQCIGADAEAHEIAVECGVPQIIVHPGNNPELTADLRPSSSPTFVTYLPPAPPLRRNREIVRSVHHLIAAPATDTEVVRSGTWSTVRTARRTLGVKITVLPRNGPEISRETAAAIAGAAACDRGLGTRINYVYLLHELPFSPPCVLNLNLRRGWIAYVEQPPSVAIDRTSLIVVVDCDSGNVRYAGQDHGSVPAKWPRTP